MNLNDYITKGWKVFQTIKHPELAKKAVRRFKKSWDLQNIYDVKLVKHFDTQYVMVRKKSQFVVNPMTEEEALHFERHLKKDMKKFDLIAKKAHSIKYLAKRLKRDDEKELAEMEVNPRTLVSIWLQFVEFAKAKIYKLNKKDWLKFAKSYEYGGSTREYAEDFWDKRDDEYGDMHPDDDDIPIEPNPIPRITPIVPTLTMGQTIGRYIVITARRKEQPIDVLGKYGLVQSAKKYEGIITRVYYREGKEQFRRKAYHAFEVLLEDGVTTWFDDWQIDLLDFVRLSSIEKEYAKESIEEIKKELKKRVKKRKKISEKELREYIGQWTKRYAEPPQRTAYDYFHELFTEMKKEEPMRKIEPSSKDKTERRLWANKVNKVLPRAIKALGEAKCKAMVKSIGYEIVKEIRPKEPKGTALLEGGYKYFYDLLKEKKELEPPKTAKIEYGQWSKKVQAIVNKTVKSIGAQNTLHLLKKLQYEVKG